MLVEFDDEMKKRGLDTVLVIGESTLGNAELTYVTQTVVPRGGIFLKRVGQKPILIVSNIDLGNAKRGRIRDVRTYGDYGYEKLLKRYGRERGYIKLIDQLLRSQRTRGRLGIYSRNEFSHLLSLTDKLRKLGYKVTGEAGASLMESLRETKDRTEISKIRSVGARASCVVEQILAMLHECRVSSGRLRLNGDVLTIGVVKSKISVLLAEQGLMTPEGTIFAVGPESADPHEMGDPSAPVRAGVPIVFDLFPVGTDGYWFDLTRTYVIGKADPRVKRMFETVLDAHTKALDLIEEGTQTSEVMNSTCDLFEQKGFRTVRGLLKGDKRAANQGFIHSLGHGVGLSIGERPYLTLFGDDTLRNNQVVTVEPGLYEPRIGGIRIEDTIVVKKRNIDNLTPLEKRLEVH